MTVETAHPWMLALSLAAVLLVFLHHLRRRRVELRVPSLALWREAMGEEAARSSRSRLFDLPLACLVLSLLLAAVGASSPVLLSARTAPRPVVIVLDCSASTLAGDAFGKARAAALSFVRSLPAETPVTVVEAGAAPRIACRKGTPAQAESALYAAAPLEVEADLFEAARLAGSLDASLRLLYTDAPLSLPGGFRCLSFGEPLPNTGITAASLEPGGLFLAAANYSPRPWKGSLVLRAGGAKTVAARLELGPGERRDILLTLGVPEGERFELALDPGDSFPADDVLRVGRSGAAGITVAVAGVGLRPPSSKGILGALDSLEGVRTVHIDGREFPRDVEADAFIGVGTPWPDGDVPALCFLPAGGKGPVAAGGSLSGRLSVVVPPHPFFTGRDGGPLAVERGRVTAGRKLAGTEGWREVLACGGEGALFVRGTRWAAAFDPELGPDCWCRDLTFALFVARFADAVRDASRRPLLRRTDVRHPHTGFFEGAGYNLLSDAESDLTRRAVRGEAPAPPTGGSAAPRRLPLGPWLLAAAALAFMLALAFERRV